MLVQLVKHHFFQVRTTLPTTNMAPENRPKTKKERIVSQSLFYRGGLLVSAKVLNADKTIHPDSL